MSSAKAGVHVHDVVTENDFVKMRSERDKALDVPMLILPSMQIKHARGCVPASLGQRGLVS